jgi:Ribonuclease G/E
MKGRIAVLGHLEDQTASALIEDGQLVDLLIDAPGEAPVPGSIYRAITERPVKGQGGIFLRLPDGGKAYLRQAKGLAPGEALLVMVTGYSEDGKATPVTPKILFKSKYAIVTPDAPGLNISRSIRDDDLRDELMVIAHEEMEGSEAGLILRSACATASAEDIAEDISAMRAFADQIATDAEGAEPELLMEGPNAHHMAWREWDVDEVATDDAAFDNHQVLDLIETFTHAYAPLSGGGHLFIEPTRALVAVDVNTGKDMSLAAGLKANLAMAKDLPRQLRIRGLGGQITLDLAPMPKKDRKMFEQSLRAQLRKDAVDTVLAGWTPLGCYELQRKRERLPLKLLLPEGVL